jgi:hypothetical protein
VQLRRTGDEVRLEQRRVNGLTENVLGVGLEELVLALQQDRLHRGYDRLAVHVLDIMQTAHEPSDTNRHALMDRRCERPALLPLRVADGALG